MRERLLPAGYDLRDYDGSDGPAPTTTEEWYLLRHRATGTRVVTRMQDLDAALASLRLVVTGDARYVPERTH